MSVNELETISTTRHDLFSYLTKEVKNAFISLPLELQSQTDFELESLFKPSLIDWAIRKRLWSLFDKAKENGLTEIPTTSIFEDICTEQNFYGRTIKNPLKLAWLSIRPNTYETIIDRSFYLGMNKILDFIQKTEIDGKNFANFLRLVHFLADRAIGPVTHKLETKSLTATMDLGSKGFGSKEEIEKQILDLEEKLSNKSVAIDVDPT